MFKKIRNLVGAILSLFVITFFSFNAEQIHNDYLRSTVGESTVYVLSPSGGGGTGFAVRSDSGTDFIMTNKHVCESAVNGWVGIAKDGTSSVYKRVVYKDNKHDLCLIEGDKRLSPLSLGSFPDIGELHYVVGHPGLRQLTISKGEYIGNHIVQLIDDVEKREQCKGKIYELNPLQQMFIGREFVCLRSYDSFATTAVTYPGNSGSPVVNKYGNLIGVLFAGDRDEEHNNFLVPLKEIKRVLSKF